MRSLVDFIRISNDHINYDSSDEFKEKRQKELNEYLDNLSYKELNESAYKNQHLWINSKDKENFYHDIQTWSKQKYTPWISEIINENLKSSSIEDFCKALDKKFSNIINDIIIKDTSNNRIDNSSAIIVKFNNKNDIDDNLDEIVEICKWHRYYITEELLTELTFEPLETEEVTKDIKNDFNNKIYRLIPNSIIDSVKKNGLIVYGMSGKDISDPIYYLSKEHYKELLRKQSKDSLRNRLQRITTYRMFPNRVFIYYTDIDPKDAAIELGKTIKRNFNKNNYSIVEIDLKNHKIPLFRDSMMDNSNNHIKYAYSNIDIPPNLITKIINL